VERARDYASGGGGGGAPAGGSGRSSGMRDAGGGT
jgi:hypothetical protein